MSRRVECPETDKLQLLKRIKPTGSAMTAVDIADRDDGGNVASEEQGMALPVRIWLWSVAALIFVMIVVGGATRLTDSGLSITEWKPVVGALPPLSEQAWQAELEKYRQIPEYQLINKGMSLEEFKAIYWWEWGHRLLGRLIGFAFLIPLVWFWMRGRISPALKPKLAGLFVLGGLQGALGWYMVMSGLVDRVDVSQYRLAAHLGLAVLIYAWIVWLVVEPGKGRDPASDGSGFRSAAIAAGALAALIYLQIILGAFVAGIDAGMAYNTWPLMDGAIVPSGLMLMTPWYLNPFENALAVQFNHRIVAYVIAVFAVLHVISVLRRGTGEAGISALVLVLAVAGQVGLGIWTLLAQVPIDLGLAHQAGAIVLLTVALWHLKRLASGIAAGQ